MNRRLNLLIASLLLAPTIAFNQYKSPFAGRATSVCSRAELTTELSCPPSRSDLSTMRRGSTMSMPPFLKRLGLKKPDKPIFGGGKKEDDDGAVATKEQITTDTDAADESAVECIIRGEEKKETETEKLLRQVKEAGTAGFVSYALWEWAFWIVSIPVCIFGYREVAGHWPDFSNPEDMKKLGAEAFAFVNFARFAVPLRIGLALSTTPWIQENVMDRFFPKKEQDLPYCEEEPLKGSD